MLKVELHTHTADDPVDRIPYTSRELIDRAAALGYQALAITLHERQLDIRPLQSYAADRGITLIPGVERSIEGRHVLLLNFPEEAERLETFDDLAAFRRRYHGLVIAPHPFFPSGTSLYGQLDRHVDLFDAVEINAMFTRTVNFNGAAVRCAARHGKPLVGNGDVHRLPQLGSTWSMVDAPPDAGAICAAIVAGKVRVESRPLSWMEVARVLPDIVATGVLRRIGDRSRTAPQPTPRPSYHRR
jgi:predicted metal-dependent phosphoesterase TrpH